MDKKILRMVYTKISSAREATAGCEVLDIPQVLERLDEAIEICGTFRDMGNLGAVQITLGEIRKEIRKVKVYGDRLKPDRELCDILNEMLKVLG
jgi:hypothetical protein